LPRTSEFEGKNQEAGIK